MGNSGKNWKAVNKLRFSKRYRKTLDKIEVITNNTESFILSSVMVFQIIYIMVTYTGITYPGNGGIEK